MDDDEPRYRPWLSIPAEDYEAHMGAPEVGQLAALGRAFAESYHRSRPRRVMLIGVATGNGLEHVLSEVTERVVCLDVNPDYLAVTGERYGSKLEGLELVCADAERHEEDPESFELIFAGLIFEYVDPARLLARIARWLAPGGLCCVVLQLPGGGHGPVSETGVDSLRRLAPIMRLLSADELERTAGDAGLKSVAKHELHLPAGKRLLVAHLEHAK